jgi:hypothetical protein
MIAVFISLKNYFDITDKIIALAYQLVITLPYKLIIYPTAIKS